ncbi:hypothetical protein CPB83DRAFT_757713 [Crepidotus variabilis]|uniref:RNA-binding protein 5 n=1 Tax=Crepidotus variabilis TaxID=179855 RepID=A0A9P6JTP6_9AGAR|nr:hypothetical protein CPB83DRAFT_757713 [Crepidotus variabilis]
MAYNREWDKGKDAWNESHSWSGQDTREREEDYYGDGKRRKYNTGGYDNSQGYDDNTYANDQYNRQNEWSQDYGAEDRSRSGGAGFPKKRLVPSERSPHVIFLGLDPDFSEADLQAYLLSNSCNVETVTIIRERTSGTCTFVSASCTCIDGFGFAQFSSIEHAKAFVDARFPFVQMPPPASHGASAKAAFYNAIESGGQHNGRRVKIDYSQSATPQERGRMTRGNLNDGTRDIGNTQAAVLLFRGLDPLSGPQAIHQAMLSSSGPNKKGAKGMKRIILIKDKVTMASFGFAFVEFVDVQFASEVLGATMSPQIHPSGFRISDKPVAASFAHPYSFQPVTDFLQRDESCLMSSSALGGVEGQWVRYWDEASTVAVLEFKVDEVIQSTVTASQANVKKEKKKKNDLETPKVAAAQPSALPISDKPVTLSFSKGVKLTCTSAVPATHAKLPVLGFDDTAPEDSQEEALHEPNKRKYPKQGLKYLLMYVWLTALIVKKVAPLIASKKTANNITKWNQVQEELSHDSSTVDRPPPASAATVVVPTPPKLVDVSPGPEMELEFSDITSLTCLLCARQFKTLDVLKRHNTESGLHKKNYLNQSLREIAREKVAARKAADAPKYRDRASERRSLFNQPDTPLPEKEGSSSTAVNKRKFTEVSTQPVITPPPAQPVHLGKDDTNMGNKLLKMMGWKEGTGLGSEADGRVDPIETAVYVPGAGLGASKGKDVAKYADGFSSYSQMAQDSARERYGS